MKNDTVMDSEEDAENDSSSETSEDDIVEDLEDVKDKKRDHSHVIDADNEDEDSEAGSKKMKFSSEKEMKRLMKPATADELNRLKETQNLFHSNLFRLQIEEMLKEVQLKQKYKNSFQAWYEKLVTHIMKLKDGREKRALNEQKWLKSLKVSVPIPRLPDIFKGTYQFQKPLKIEIVGSHILETQIGPKVTVDIAVELPQKFYHKDDFSNGKYHLKRAFYLCDLISHLQNCSELVEDINFVSDGIDVLKPKVEIKPAGKLSKCITVLLTVLVHFKGIDMSVFKPSKNNVNRKWFFSNENDTAANSAYDSPTPFYNSTIISDLTFLENHNLMMNVLQPHKNIKDGIILLKVWLRQRELSSGLCDFNGFVITALVVYLFQIRKINSFMSSYQVFRSVLNYLVSCDWTKNGITLNKSSNDKNIPLVDEFHEYHKVVFIDCTGHYNLCYGMHSSTFKQIKHEAQRALNALDDPNINSFQVLFMTSVPFYRSFDQLFVFHNDEALLNIVDIYGSDEDKLNYCGTIYPLMLNMVYDVLEKGFGERVNYLCVRQLQKNRWKAQKKFRYFLCPSFGLNLNPEKYYLMVEKAAENEMEAFRELWGNRSELRRFQDGTITEAVVWDAKCFSEKRSISKQIVTYLLKIKFGLEGCDFKYIGDQFEKFIDKRGEESSMKVIEVYDKLNKQLRNLKELPLGIINVQGTSPVLRYTDISPLSCRELGPDKRKKRGDPPVEENNSIYKKVNENASSVPPFVNPVQLIAQMCATNKWPQDLGAVNRLRTAFYLKISQLLTTQFNLQTQVFTDRLKVLKEGLVFDLKIYCPNEIALLKKVVEDGVVKYRDNEFSLAIEKQMILLPKLSSALHGLYEQHTSFGPACCLVKRWVNSQMIDSFHIAEEVLEMLVASLYLNPGPYEVPQQPQVAFFRFLHMVATTDWNSEYIVLNINNELNREDMLVIESHFTANRDSLPALFIATPYDRKKSVWTQGSPTPLILLRLVQMCSNVIDFLQKRIYRNIALEDEIKVLFEPSLEPYDAIIHINVNFIPKVRSSDCEKEESIDVTFIPVSGFNPVSLYLSELREAYDDVALFFYNAYGGSQIGVLWKPDAFYPKDFKVTNMAKHLYDENTKKLRLEKELIVEDFMVIGKGIVKYVELKQNGNRKSYTFL